MTCIVIESQGYLTEYVTLSLHAAEAATPAVGGYLQWMDVGGGVEGWGGAASLLTGSGGIALALLAGLGHEEPRWDRMLLVDIPLT